MISFENDYSEGAHQQILDDLLKNNLIQESGYGNDAFTISAKEKIKEVIGLESVEVTLLTGGTQTNQIVIDSLLSSFQGVISPSSGHINTHEAGAIEFGGHKVLSLKHTDGKLAADDVREYLNTFYSDSSHSHMVFPGMVYISFPTEYGTLYSKQELTELYTVCTEYNIPFYIDGARLGYGLMSDKCDLTITDIANLCDVFYIGATKIGALCGEAVVFTKGNTPKYFSTIIKQHGALLAKGRLLGSQFLTLFTNNLYFEISKHALEMAKILKHNFLNKGYKMYIDSPTNQQFFIVDNSKVSELSKSVKFTTWEKYDTNSYILRFVTSWATTEESIRQLEQLL